MPLSTLSHSGARSSTSAQFMFSLAAASLTPRPKAWHTPDLARTTARDTHTPSLGGGVSGVGVGVEGEEVVNEMEEVEEYERVEEGG